MFCLHCLLLWNNVSSYKEDDILWYAILQKSIFQKKQKQKNIELSSNYEETLKTYCKLVEKYGYVLEFKKGRNLTFSNLGANAGVFNNSSIVATPEWAFRLVATDDANVPFMITLGHELTHKEKEFPCFRHLLDLQFCTWVNEVHADYGATEKMFDCSRNALLTSIDYKLRYKREHQKGDIEDLTHPSWARRKYYAEHFDFNADLIQQIAKDTECKNQKLIDKMCNFYKEIVLI